MLGPVWKSSTFRMRWIEMHNLVTYLLSSMMNQEVGERLLVTVIS